MSDACGGRDVGAEARRGGGVGWVGRGERDVMRERKGGVGVGGEVGKCGRLGEKRESSEVRAGVVLII